MQNIYHAGYTGVLPEYRDDITRVLQTMQNVYHAGYTGVLPEYRDNIT